MTTAHKPTWHPAVGTATQGGYRYHAPKAQFSAKDIAAHTQLKTRQLGQDAPTEVAERDLKAELSNREKKYAEKVRTEKQRAGLLPYAAEPPNDVNKAIQAVDWRKINDKDDSDSDDDSDSSSSESDDDDEEELKKELERIKAEREEEQKRKELEEAKEAEREKDEEIIRGNPLLNLSSDGGFAVKRKWNDDVVFRNQSRDHKKVPKRYINDMIRSDPHRNFLKRYIQ